MKAGEVDLDLHEADTPDGTAADCERISKLPEQDAELDNLYKGVPPTEGRAPAKTGRIRDGFQ